MERDSDEEVMDILSHLKDSETKLLGKIIKIERDKIHMKNPIGVHDKIKEAVKETIQ